MSQVWPKSRRDLRLASGLVLFVYVTLHLVSHSFGLVSLANAEAALRVTVRFWHSGLGTALLYGAAAVHVGLALLAFYERRTLRMPPAQALRIVLGLTMPVVLIGHFVATRYAFAAFGLPTDYQRVVASLWATHGQGRQLALLAPGWLHGCLGLTFAFGHRHLWRRLRFGLFGAALLLPVLAGLGFLTMGRELAEHRAVVDDSRAEVTAAESAALVDVREQMLAAYLGLIGLAVGARARALCAPSTSATQRAWSESPILGAASLCRAAGQCSKRAAASRSHISQRAVVAHVARLAGSS